MQESESINVWRIQPHIKIDKLVSHKNVTCDKYPNCIELRAENPTMKTLEFEGEAINSIRILGKAVYFISKVI